MCHNLAEFCSREVSFIENEGLLSPSARCADDFTIFWVASFKVVVAIQGPPPVQILY